MTDIFDQATDREERDRELAIQAVRNARKRDFESEVCNGCQYATKTSWGRTCEVWPECLEDLTKREKACRA